MSNPPIPGSTKQPPLSEQRASIGLKTPSPEAMELIWSRVESPTAGIKFGYEPLATAAAAHYSDTRGIAVSGGWRAGKSTMAGFHAVSWLPYAQLIWLVAKDYDMSRQEFMYLMEGGISTGLVAPRDVHMSLNKYQPSALRSVTGCLVETRTLADHRKLAARPPDLVIVCEPGLIDNLDDVMELLWGRVAEKRGQILLAGTSDEASEDWFKLFREWEDPNNVDGGAAFSIPTWDNHHRFPLGMDELVFTSYRQKYGEEEFLAHYGGIPSAPKDLVLKNFWRPGMHIDPAVEFNPGLPVEIAIDPNYANENRYSVEFIQWDQDDIFIIDEVAEEGLTHDQMKALCEQREAWPYVIGGTMDPYAGDSHVFGSPAPLGYWHPLELRINHKPRVATTIQAIKEAMSLKSNGNPRLHVSPRAERFIWEASRWRQEKTRQPSKKNCDAQKAFGYWCVDRFSSQRLHPDHDNSYEDVVDWEFV